MLRIGPRRSSFWALVSDGECHLCHLTFCRVGRKWIERKFWIYRHSHRHTRSSAQTRPGGDGGLRAFALSKHQKACMFGQWVESTSTKYFMQVRVPSYVNTCAIRDMQVENSLRSYVVRVAARYMYNTRTRTCNVKTYNASSRNGSESAW